ncbi:MAG: hypothetical protein GDA50_04020 [Alphaproteobacteria bacterium GM202ARS2]|nr:hypothetical protein [Alphaproteobacteria bacterium GM202ARS2]
MNDLAQIDISKAPLPARYEAAKLALRKCYEVDECKEWSDKMVALKSYARQTEDPELEAYTKRIHGRAQRRLNELLAEHKARGKHKNRGNQHKSGRINGTVNSSKTKGRIAEGAGLSKRQVNTATNIGNIPADKFEELIEQKDPPTVTRLAQIGKTYGPKHTKQKPKLRKESTRAIGSIREFHEFARQHSPQLVASGVAAEEIEAVLEALTFIQPWMSEFGRRLADELE